MTGSVHKMEAVRQSALFADIISLRLACNLPGDGDEALFQSHYGPQGSFLFWGNFLQGVVEVSAFVQHVAQARAEQWDRIDVIRLALQKALLQAYQGDEDFFRGDLSELGQVSYFHEIKKPERIKLLGRKAAEWLLSSPKWQHLTPNTLAAFLRGEKPVSTAPAPLAVGLPKAKTGPKGDLTKRVAGKMLADLRSGKTTVEALWREKRESLASEYGAGRTTVTAALKMAVSQFATHLNSDK